MSKELIAVIGVMATAAFAAVSAGLFVETISVFVDHERRSALLTRFKRVGLGKALGELLGDTRHEDELFAARRDRLRHDKGHHQPKPARHARAHH
jgi:hypothetical protein